MTDRPYTDDDLITEAAKQHKTATEDPEFMCIGEQMDGTEPWNSLGEDDYDSAQRAIDNLLHGAADTSEWAIRLGDDGLQPSGHALDLGPSSQPPRVRIHFAFAPDMAEQDRADLIAQIAAFTIAGLT